MPSEDEVIKGAAKVVLPFDKAKPLDPADVVEADGEDALPPEADDQHGEED